jgi:hypothetical protein
VWLGYKPIGVPGECGDSFHAVAFPDDDLVLAVAVGGDDFVLALAEHEIANLAARVFF